MKKTREQNGITLIALIITIVVLLILAVVAIRAVQGNGIIRYAQNARNDYGTKASEEQETINGYLSKIEDSLKAGTGSVDIHNGKTIPEGATYNRCVSYLDDEYDMERFKIELTYTTNELFPEPQPGDIYTYGDYQYCYKYSWCCDTWSHMCNCFLPTEAEEWAVRYIGDLSATPGVFLNSINGKTVATMIYTFEGCKGLTSLDGFEIPSSVTDMYGTFIRCTGLTSLDGFEIPNSVTNMDYTFNGCKGLTSLDGFEIPNSVTNMVCTFASCTGLTSLDGFEIPNSVTNMNSTFANCTGLTSLDGFEIPNSVTNMFQTFNECTGLTSLDGFEIPNSVTNMMSTFKGCKGLTSLDGFEIPNSVTNMRQTFASCTGLTGSITINATPTSYSSCLQRTNITQILGDCPDNIKAAILATK